MSDKWDELRKRVIAERPVERMFLDPQVVLELLDELASAKQTIEDLRFEAGAKTGIGYELIEKLNRAKQANQTLRAAVLEAQRIIEREISICHVCRGREGYVRCVACEPMRDWIRALQAALEREQGK